jgi:BirA family biotin operon repressor/biotin-[acetyl-CoA-carboxylase] ligase
MAARERRAARADGGVQPLAARVFAQLADGRFHSGEALAQALGVSRGAIWKAVRTLRSLGATLHAVPNRGYRLRSADHSEPGFGSEALDAGRIMSLLPASARASVRDVQTTWMVDSTNSVLLRRPNPPLGMCEAFLAEYQSAGRGRRGRSWLAPPGGAICLSLNWSFREVPTDLGALGLAIGVCVLRTLRGAGLDRASLKWPNDILVEGRKLGGILIELRAEGGGPASVVIGIGLNVALGEALLAEIERTGMPATDLAASGVTRLSRNMLAAALTGRVVEGLKRFESDAMRPFIEEWRAADALQGLQIEVRTAAGNVCGWAKGIDLHGALVVETPHGLQRFISGEVTVRPMQ